jgi:hypothetical protein
VSRAARAARHRAAGVCCCAVGAINWVSLADPGRCCKRIADAWQMQEGARTVASLILKMSAQ